MVEFAEISKEKRAVIIELSKLNYSTRQIARQMKVSQSMVVRAVQRFTETSFNASRKRSDRPRVTSKNEDKYIVVTSKRQRIFTAPDIQ